MKKIAVVAKIQDPRCRGVAEGLMGWLSQRGYLPLPEARLAMHLGLDMSDRNQQIREQSDMVVVLGGDGTLISAARLIGDRQVPIFGVNLGSLGFLTETTIEELYPALEGFFAGRYKVSERMVLAVSVQRHGQEIARQHALNDAVINKGSPAKIIDLDTFVNDSFLTTFKSDGLIVASPTGSTGYSLSANGPIIDPSLDSLVITPLCSHTLTNRPLVIDPAARIRVVLRSRIENVVLTMDGQVSIELRYGDVVEVRRADHRARLVLSSNRDFYEVLRTKLKWGER